MSEKNKNQFQKMLESFQSHWEQLSKKNKMIIMTTAIALLIFAVVVAFLLNTSNGKYEVLYAGTSPEESAEIYTELKSRGVNAQISGNNEIMVPSAESDSLRLQLSVMGYPRTGLSYPVFTSNAGIMSSEMEKKQYLLMDVQTRLETAMLGINGVRKSVITLNIADNDNYIWQGTDEKNTGTVLVTLDPQVELTTQQVKAIKTLVAKSVPKLKEEDVAIIDSRTMLELGATETEYESGLIGTLKQLDFEETISTKMENKIKKLLSLPYGTQNVEVAVTVELDYDKIITEEMTYVPEEDGNGVISNQEISSGTSGNSVGGIAGENSNTDDIPEYNINGGNNGGVNQSYEKTEYLVSYIKRQIQKDATPIKTASVSVIVNDDNLTDFKRNSLIQTISNAVNVDPSFVSVNSFGSFVNTEKQPMIDEPLSLNNSLTLVALIVGGVLAIFLLVAVIRSILKTRKQEKLIKKMGERKVEEVPVIKEVVVEEKVDSDAMMDDNEQNHLVDVLGEMKLELVEDEESKQMLDSIIEFAKKNPEVIANLITIWLKEGE